MADKLLLSGDAQSGTDHLLLSGDAQSGTDVLLLSTAAIPNGIRVSQAGTISVAESGTPDIRVSQLGIISIGSGEPSPIQICQLGIISVIGNGKNFISLERVVALPCWQPCASYGTYSTVIIYP